MNTFTYSNKYATYEECYFQVGKYINGNTAIEIWNNEDGPITKVTVNPDIKLPDDRIAIKNYSENEGMVAWLLLHGFIDYEPVQIIKSGLVEIPVYMLTAKGKKYLSD